MYLTQLCDKCGTQHHHQQNRPAYGLECYNCGQKNYFPVFVKAASLSTQHSVALDESEPSNDLFYRYVTNNTPDWKVYILVNYQRVSFKTDIGAQYNVTSKANTTNSVQRHFKNHTRDLLHLVVNT